MATWTPTYGYIETIYPHSAKLCGVRLAAISAVTGDLYGSLKEGYMGIYWVLAKDVFVDKTPYWIPEPYLPSGVHLNRI